MKRVQLESQEVNQRTPNAFFMVHLFLAIGLFLRSSACRWPVAEYPEREITLIVPWAAGGGTDLMTRVLAAI